jgi:hypothetical protein
MQHAVVVAIALACAIGFVVRRVRTLRGRAPLCDGCAREKTCGSTPLEVPPIPPRALVRRRSIAT